MNSPKFSVGEVVILQSKLQQECNGEYSIERIVSGRRPCVYTNKYIDGNFYELKGLVGTMGNTLWDECWLKKKHQPGEMSFNELMNSLKSPLKVD